jgi:hypothetical protein
MSVLSEQLFPLRKPKSSCVLIGQDSRGHWVAMDRHRACGGLFVSRDAALSFALAENGNRRDAVEIVNETLELTADSLGVVRTVAARSQVDADGGQF